jgi:nitroimidazol reductase NimA-like FMN-containing flavoprotein (pyridoxamine 5'-phosphate oxidase superfamily)
MIPDLRRSIVSMLSGHRTMMLATSRADGWPQASALNYANDGLTLYCAIPRDEKVFTDVLRDSRISVAIADDARTPADMKTLRLTGRAHLVDGGNEYERVRGVFVERFPERSGWPAPNPLAAPFLRIVPDFISIVDRAIGLNRSACVAVTPSDLALQTPKNDHDWLHLVPPAETRVVPAVRPAGLSAVVGFTPFYPRNPKQ